MNTQDSQKGSQRSQKRPSQEMDALVLVNPLQFRHQVASAGLAPPTPRLACIPTG